MAHYRDGTEAKVGDLVKGITYNRGGRVVVGEVIQITPDHDSCNLMVALPGKQPLPSGIASEVLLKFLYDGKLGGYVVATAFHGIADGSNNPTEWYLITGDVDYGQTDQFDLVHRPDA